MKLKLISKPMVKTLGIQLYTKTINFSHYPWSTKSSTKQGTHEIRRQWEDDIII